MKKLILIILSLLLISMYGCAKRQTQTSFDSSSTSRVVEKPKPKYAEVTVVRDDFQKKTTFTGNSVDGQSVDGLSADGLSMNILLSGSKVDTYPNVDAVVQIYVSSHYKSKDWRSYETAYDSDGTRYETVHISHDASSCSERGCIFIEVIGIAITKQYLESHKDKEMKFQISGKGGKEVFSIPPEYTKVFLDAIK